MGDELTQQEKERKQYLNMLKNVAYSREQIIKKIHYLASSTIQEPTKILEEIVEVIRLSGIYVERQS